MIPAKSRAPQSTVSFCRTLILPLALLTFMAAALFSSPTTDAQTNDDANRNGNTVPANTGVVTNNNGNISSETDERGRSSVRGRVVYDDTEQPVRRARLMLMPIKNGGSGRSEFTAVTNMHGEFRFRNIKAGRYFMMVSAPGVVTPLAFLSLGGERRGAREEIDFSEAAKLFDEIAVDGARDVQRDVRALRGGIITGTVAYADGAPAVNVCVQIMRRKDGKLVPVVPNVLSFFMSMRTDDRGVYRVSGLPAGEYYISISESNTGEGGQGNRSPEEEFFGRGDALGAVYYPSATVPREAASVEVALGGERAGIDITLPDRRMNVVEGVIIRGRGGDEPVPNATVRLKRADAGVLSIFATEGQSTTTDEEGRWSFSEVPEGTYALSIEPPHETEHSGNMNMNVNMSGSMDSMNSNNMNMNMNISSPRRPRRPRLTSKQQELKVADADLSLRIELAEGGRVTGIVETEGKSKSNDNLSTGIGIVLRNSDISQEHSTYVPGDGKFEIESIPAGEFFVGVNSFSESSAVYVKSAAANGIDLLREPLRVEEGREIRGVRIVLSVDVATLTGRLRPTAGDAPPGIQMIAAFPTDAKLRRNNSLRQYSLTDENGRYTFSLAPGEYTIVPMKDLDEYATLGEQGIAAASSRSNAVRVALRSNERRQLDMTAAP